MMDRVGVGAEAAGSRPGRAAIGRPYRFPIPVHGHAIRPSPGPRLEIQLCPIADDTKRIRGGVDGLDLVGQNGASPLLALNAASLKRRPDDDQRNKPESYES